MMKSAEDILKDFVEGRISPYLFGSYISGEKSGEEDAGERLKEYLSDDSIDWQGTYLEKDGPYLYLLQMNYFNFSDIVDAIGAVELFLTRKGLIVNTDTRYEKVYDLILAIQPAYLDVDIDFVMDKIYPDDVNIAKSEIRQTMRERFTQFFKYQSKPPQWLQNPAWPIHNGQPLYFIGQLPLTNQELFHDTGYVYLFLNIDSGEFFNVTQFY